MWGLERRLLGRATATSWACLAAIEGKAAAYLLRDVEAGSESPQAAERDFAVLLGLWMDDLWELWREQAAGRLSRDDYLLQAAQVRDRFTQWLASQQGLPKYVARLQKRILIQS